MSKPKGIMDWLERPKEERIQAVGGLTEEDYKHWFKEEKTMSVSIYWQPKKGKPISGATSNVLNHLCNKFGSLPITLSADEDLKILEGMAEVANTEAYDEIIIALHDHNEITIWAEY